MLNRNDYPNPQLIRKNWIDLSGTWLFAFDDENTGISSKKYLLSEYYDQTITVPYSYLSNSSGVEENNYHPIVWYQKDFELNLQEDKSYIIHFEAVDYVCDIWLNDEHIFHHQGGHVPFQIDLTNHVKSKNKLTIRVEDYNSCTQPIGKQSFKDSNFLCWYTRTIGIWQPVWIEITGSTYISDLDLTPNLCDSTIGINFQLNQSETLEVKGEIRFKENIICKFSTFTRNGLGKCSVDVSSDLADFRLFYWSSDAPNLYDIDLTVIKDDIEIDCIYSYFGMRNIRVQGQRIYLNNNEVYQKLILDQGYFKNGGLTATTEELESDIRKIKEFGFNGVRKHQKVENHKFMYFCDLYGLMMWAEMPSSFEYTFDSNKNSIQELYPFIKKHSNHPSVIAYTLLNESWGINEVSINKRQQNFVNAMYYLTKSLDSERLVIGNDGWEHTLSDILTIHDYNSDALDLKNCYRDEKQAVNGSPSKTSNKLNYSNGYSYQNEPIMISEFGGIAYQTSSDHAKESWGYGGRLTTKDAVEDKIVSLIEAVLDIPYVCGFCYTQLTDVEQEVNGLLDENHDYKIDVEKVRAAVQSKNNYGFVFN